MKSVLKEEKYGDGGFIIIYYYQIYLCNCYEYYTVIYFR